MSEPQAAPALGPEDYHALLGMLTSDDASTRTQGQSLAKKLTPSEQQTFFDVQQQANKGKGELTRGDNQVTLGVAPELAVTGGIGAVRAISGAITGSAPGMASRVAAGAKATLAQATPQLKYEATKTVLEKMGVPTPLAVTAAMAVSGFKLGGKGAAAEPAPTAAAEAAPAAAAETTLSAADEAALYKQGYSPATVEKIKAAARQQTAVPSVSPVASPPVAAAVPASPVPSTAAQSPTVEAPPSVPAPSPQQMLNEEALARRRAAYQASQTAPVAAPAKPFLLSSESPEYMRLIKAGKTHQQAMDVIQANRLLQEKLGLSTPTAAETRFPKGMRGKVDPE